MTAANHVAGLTPLDSSSGDPEDESGAEVLPDSDGKDADCSAGGTNDGKKKMKRFNYGPHDLTLLKAVRATDAHVSGYGEKMKGYEKALDTFIKEVPSIVFCHQAKPSAKSLRDRFLKLVDHRKRAVKAAVSSSGISEVVAEKDVLLDDLIHEMSEHEEALKVAKEEQTDAEKKLVEAGEKIRTTALERRKKKKDSDPSDNSAEEKEKKKKRSASEWLESHNKEMMEALKRRRETEECNLHLNKAKMELDKQVLEEEKARFERTQAAAERRLRLDEARFELEKEERVARREMDREEREDARKQSALTLEIMNRMLNKLL